MIKETKILGVVIIEPQRFEDERGYFLSSYDDDVLLMHSLTFHMVTESRTMSKREVLRGLHFQLQEPQARLVEVTRGEVYDVAVDLRVGSPTFGNWANIPAARNRAWI
jgi:dTDP-4-dehydrorhamnose 3,5-epimerase